MSWNYRVCKESHSYKIGDIEGVNIVYAIHEVFYNNAGEIVANTVEPMAPIADMAPGNCETEAECMEGLTQSMEWMALALTKDVVDLDTIVYGDWDDDTEEDDEDE